MKNFFFTTVLLGGSFFLNRSMANNDGKTSESSSNINDNYLQNTHSEDLKKNDLNNILKHEEKKTPLGKRGKSKKKKKVTKMGKMAKRIKKYIQQKIKKKRLLKRKAKKHISKL